MDFQCLLRSVPGCGAAAGADIQLPGLMSWIFARVIPDTRRSGGSCTVVGLPLRGVTVSAVAVTLSMVARSRVGIGVCANAMPPLPIVSPSARVARRCLLIIWSMCC